MVEAQHRSGGPGGSLCAPGSKGFMYVRPLPSPKGLPTRSGSAPERHAQDQGCWAVACPHQLSWQVPFSCDTLHMACMARCTLSKIVTCLVKTVHSQHSQNMAW